MAKEISETNRDNAPAEDRNQNPHDRLDEKETDQKKEGDYRNVETMVNRPETFDDEKESQVEDELSNDEAKSEKERG